MTDYYSEYLAEYFDEPKKIAVSKVSKDASDTAFDTFETFDTSVPKGIEENRPLPTKANKSCKIDVSKVAKGSSESTSETFDTFDTSILDDYPKNQTLADVLADHDQRTQYEYELEERAAVMEYDGGLDRDEAERRAKVEVDSIWLARFSVQD